MYMRVSITELTPTRSRGSPWHGQKQSPRIDRDDLTSNGLSNGLHEWDTGQIDTVVFRMTTVVPERDQFVAIRKNRRSGI